MKSVGDLDMEKNILLDRDLWLHLQRINTAQKKMTMCKKDDRPLHQKRRFFLASKKVGLS